MAQRQIRAVITAGIGVLTHRNQLENSNRKAEIVVSLSADDFCKTTSMKLRWCEVFGAYNTRISVAFQTELKTVGINQCDRRIGTYQNPRVIEVADDAPGLMHCGDVPTMAPA